MVAIRKEYFMDAWTFPFSYIYVVVSNKSKKNWFTMTLEHSWSGRQVAA